SKRLAEQLGCSRREAELYIEGGWVTVDDQLVQAPFLKVLPAQRLDLLPGAKATEVPPVTLLMHKPAGQAVPQDAAAALQLLTAAGHWADDPSPIQPLQRHLLRQNLLLPMADEASGLVVFSQQREVIRLLTDARSKLEQEFIVEVSGE